MILITIAGNSTRFFDAGYKIVKYKLPIFNEKSILWHILSYINRDEKILIVANSKFNDRSWISEICHDLGFTSFLVVEISETDGQLSSVNQGLLTSLSQNFIDPIDPLLIYNGDTIRHIPFNSFVCRDLKCDGLIETFITDGNHWSFVDSLGLVSKVTEKQRISDYCSSGLYAFSSVDLFLKFYNESYFVNSERFVAPYYNVLISNGHIVKSINSNFSNFTLCGTPKEYENSI